MNRDKFEDLKDAYALSALAPDEARDFEAYIRQHPELQAEVDELAGVASLLAFSAADREPPKSLRKNLVKTVASEARPRGAARNHRRGLGAALASLADFLRARPLAFGTAGLLVVGLLSWNVLLQGQLEMLRGDNSSLQAQIESPSSSPEDSSTSRVLAMDGQGNMSSVEAEVVSYKNGQAVLVAQNMPDIPDGETFQIWVLNNGEASPSGVFESQGPSADSPVAAYVNHSIEGADAVAVTVEPEGGSEQPTSNPELTASL
ncbi:MAG: anti-sigma factor [Rubrobacter sp.]